MAWPETIKPSHPALFDMLAKQFTSSGYDHKQLVRILCNTQAYQRTSAPLSGNEGDEMYFSHMQVKVMTAPVLVSALATATSRPD